VPTNTSGSIPNSGPPSSPAWSGSTHLTYGQYGVEASYNNYLVAHNRPVTSLKDLLTTGAPITDTVTLTISTKLQEAAQAALGNRVGAIVAIDPQTGAVLAMYANPTYDPNPLASLNANTESYAFAADNTKNAAGFAPFTSLAYQDATQFGPGSTFKIGDHGGRL
jgi:peptidoglycan glycosyltransferase